jgi:peptidoglycan-associated lipoprotein
MKKIIISTACCIALFTGCGGPEPDMNSQDLREQTPRTNNATETKKVDSKLDNTKPVEKEPYQPELVAGENGEVYNSSIILVNGEKVEYKLPIVYFDFDKFNIKPEMMSSLEVFAQKLKDDNIADKTISIGGHCDEWGADEYNIALGLKRAKATEKVLRSLGVTGEIKLTSYGESKPVCMAHTQKCWQQNRRAEVSILP